MRISRHIEYCPLCFHDVEDIRDILAKFEPFPSSPPSITSRTIRRIIASLVPWQPQMVLRGDDPAVAESGWPRQYRAETMNISLHLSRSSTGELLLLGLLSSDDPEQCIEAFEGTPVELHRALSFHLDEGYTHSEQELKEKPFRISCVDDLGNVAFKALPVGEYVMVVQLPASEVIIKGLTIEQD